MPGFEPGHFELHAAGDGRLRAEHLPPVEVQHAQCSRALLAVRADLEEQLLAGRGDVEPAPGPQGQAAPGAHGHLCGARVRPARPGRLYAHHVEAPGRGLEGALDAPPVHAAFELRRFPPDRLAVRRKPSLVGPAHRRPCADGPRGLRGKLQGEGARLAGPQRRAVHLGPLDYQVGVPLHEPGEGLAGELLPAGGEEGRIRAGSRGVGRDEQHASRPAGAADEERFAAGLRQDLRARPQFQRLHHPRGAEGAAEAAQHGVLAAGRHFHCLRVAGLRRPRRAQQRPRG